MSTPSQRNYKREKLRITQQIDALCDEFESFLHAGGEPVLAPYLDRVDPFGYQQLYEELLALSIEEMARRGVDDIAATLRAANPDLADQIKSLSDGEALTELHAAGDPTSADVCGLHVRCPHCHSPIELVPDAELGSICCPSCGSDFSLISDGMETRRESTVSEVGHFLLKERVGMGAFGTVWKAYDTKLERTVAIKIPRKGQFDSKQERAFLREAQNAAQLRHSNIVPVHEVGRDGDTLYIVSEFVHGITLAAWLTGQQPTLREAAELCAKIAFALEHAHDRGVIHRDLKPGNIMLNAEAEPFLMDFGLAKREATEITMSLDGHVLGTPAYMSPEQARGEASAADRRSDVYSLGVILFQLLTGELPFRGNVRMLIHQVINDEPPSPRKLNGNVSRDLETITLCCLEKSPDRRYGSAREVAEELGRYLNGEPIERRPVGRVERTTKWMNRHRTVARLSLALVFTLLVGTIISNYFAFSYMVEAQRSQLSEKKAEAAKLLAESRVDEVEAANALAESRLQEAKNATELAESRLQEVESARALAETRLREVEVAKSMAEEHLRETERSKKEETWARRESESAYELAESRRKDAVVVTDYLLKAFDISVVDGNANTFSVAEFLRNAKSHSKDLQGQPLRQSKLLRAIGKAELNLELTSEAILSYSEALRLQRASVGDRHTLTYVTARAIAQDLIDAGKLKEAGDLCRELTSVYLSYLSAHDGSLSSRSKDTVYKLAIASEDSDLIIQAAVLRGKHSGGGRQQKDPAWQYYDRLRRVFEFAEKAEDGGEALAAADEALGKQLSSFGADKNDEVVFLSYFADRWNHDERWSLAERFGRKADEIAKQHLTEDNSYRVRLLQIRNATRNRVPVEKKEDDVIFLAVKLHLQYSEPLLRAKSSAWNHYNSLRRMFELAEQIDDNGIALAKADKVLQHLLTLFDGVQSEEMVFLSENADRWNLAKRWSLAERFSAMADEIGREHLAEDSPYRARLLRIIENTRSRTSEESAMSVHAKADVPYISPTIEELRKLVGEETTVQLRVLGTGGNNHVYLNSLKDYLDERSFNIKIDKSVVSKLPSVGFRDPWQELPGKTVAATGHIQTAGQTLLMVITDLEKAGLRIVDRSKITTKESEVLEPSRGQ